MRDALTDNEWTAIKPMLPNKPRGAPRLNDRRVLDGIFEGQGARLQCRELAFRMASARFPKFVIQGSTLLDEFRKAKGTRLHTHKR